MREAKHLKPGSEEWPSQLASLGEAEPSQLWCVGRANLRLLALRSVAIVGCRAASAYGRAVASEFAAELAANGWSVVSGAAFGIDAAAHRGALAVGGCTMAVLPGGPDIPVPKAHEALLREIQENGLIVSENDCGVPVRKHMFLTRNRLIAALVRGVLVIEADLRSGSLNTARHGERLGRLVMATPGPVTGRQSRGTHELIRARRAELVASPRDVMELLEPIGDLPSPNEKHLGPPTGTMRDLLSGLGTDPLPLAKLAGGSHVSDQEALAGLTALRSRNLAEQTVEGWRSPVRPHKMSGAQEQSQVE